MSFWCIDETVYTCYAQVRWVQTILRVEVKHQSEQRREVMVNQLRRGSLVAASIVQKTSYWLSGREVRETWSLYLSSKQELSWTKTRGWWTIKQYHLSELINIDDTVFEQSDSDPKRLLQQWLHYSNWAYSFHGAHNFCVKPRAKQADDKPHQLHGTACVIV